MPSISLLIKPASSLCNLRCNYCFYHSIARKRQTESYGIMKDETAVFLISKALDYAEDSCTFAFQGGEPTLAGLDYFETFVKQVKKANVKNIPVHYVIQTNGMEINKEWATFFVENKFLVGLSLDGPKEIHDASRIDAYGKGSFNRVMRAIQVFNDFGVEYNILCVVTSNTARHINKVYNFFKKHNFNYLQFIPCLDPLDEMPGAHEYSLTPERYTAFLKILLDEWYKDIKNGNRISIRYFDNLVGMLMGHPPESCGMSGVCSLNFVVEADGGVYPCDFYAIDKWRLGSILINGFEEMKMSDEASDFLHRSNYIDPLCNECECRILCRGGCRRSREPFLDGNPILNYYCSSNKEFFRYAEKRLQEIAYLFYH